MEKRDEQRLSAVEPGEAAEKSLRCIFPHLDIFDTPRRLRASRSSQYLLTSTYPAAIWSI